MSAEDDYWSECIAAANPAAITKLLDRLEAAEKERDWNTERLEDAIEECAALRAKIETMEKEVAHIKEVEFPRKMRAVAAGWKTKCTRLEQERVIDEQRIADLMAELNQVGQENEELRAELKAAHAMALNGIEWREMATHPSTDSE